MIHEPLQKTNRSRGEASASGFSPQHPKRQTTPLAVKYSTMPGLEKILDLCNYRMPRLTGTESVDVRLAGN